MDVAAADTNSLHSHQHVWGHDPLKSIETWGSHGNPSETVRER